MEIRLNKKEVLFGLFSGFLANFLGMIITIIVLFQETNSSNIFKIINDSFLDNYHQLIHLINLDPKTLSDHHNFFVYFEVP